MPVVNPLARELVFKIVYYGPGLGGKTTSLQHVHQTARPEHRGRLVSLATPVDRTLYFDFLPVRLPDVRGMSVRLQLFTVPGQVYYNATRKLVLTGADGVVMVVDSQAERLDANLESLDNLRDNLREHGRSLEDVPWVLQYNKRDLPSVLPRAELERRLNSLGVQSFESTATTGSGVYEALDAVTRMVLGELERRLPTGGSHEGPGFLLAEGGLAAVLQSAAPAPVAPSQPPAKPASSANAAAASGSSSAARSAPSAPSPAASAAAVSVSSSSSISAPSSAATSTPSSAATSAPSSATTSTPISAKGQASTPSASVSSPAASERPSGNGARRTVPAPVEDVVKQRIAEARSERADAPPGPPPRPPTLPSIPSSRLSDLPLHADASDASDAADGGETGSSFAPLFAAAERAEVREVEQSLSQGDCAQAILVMDRLVARLLASAAAPLSGGADAPRDPGLMVLMLGVSGRRYVSFRGLVRDARTRPVDREAALLAYAFVLELCAARRECAR
ncbi:MAG: ADP-ribosylation factor-like protein [Polyangiaceae bacterium]